MIEIDLNDTVSVELTEWGAAYLNATNIFKEITTTQKYHYKTDYKAGDDLQKPALGVDIGVQRWD